MTRLKSLSIKAFDTTKKALQILIGFLGIVSCFFIGACSVEEPSQSEPAACEIETPQFLFAAAGGFSQSPKNPDIFIYARPDEKGIFQIRQHNVNTGDDLCLSCDVIKGAPAPTLHKGAPAFLPDGEHFVLQVEMETHPFEDILGEPGAGFFNNLWLASKDGTQWFQLTDLPNGPEDTSGVLIPEPSPDGQKLVWAQLFGSDPIAQAAYQAGDIVLNRAPFGRWQLNLADLVLEPFPHLENIEEIQPGDDSTFYETQGWSPDGNSFQFASDIDREFIHQLDIWSFDLRTRTPQKITDTADQWEEFARVSPDGKKVAFMASCCGFEPLNPDSIPFGQNLATEMFLADSDGKNPIQLTHFNTSGFPESFEGRTVVTKMKWDEDNRTLYYELVAFSSKGSPLGAGVVQMELSDACFP